MIATVILYVASSSACVAGIASSPVMRTQSGYLEWSASSSGGSFRPFRSRDALDRAFFPRRQSSVAIRLLRSSSMTSSRGKSF